MHKKNILLCVAGMTPQIITETLFALHKKGERIDEIRVITTLEGQKRINQTLLNPNSGKFYEFCRDFEISPSSVKFDQTTIALLDKPDGTTLEDIRTVEENVLAGDKICKIVAELCKDANIRIHASAAGGRKTMSIYLTAAIQLFGRADDSLSHVLVSADFESHPQFFYPPPKPKMLDITDRETKKVLRQISTADAEVFLAEIPFIRLQGTRTSLLVKEGQNYGDVVREAQNYLDTQENDFKLRLDPKLNKLSVGSLETILSVYEMLLYLLFAEKKFNKVGKNGDGFVYLTDLNRTDFEKAFQSMMIAKEGSMCPFTEKHLRDTEWGFLLTVVEQCQSAKAKDYEDFMNSVVRAISRSNKKLKKAGIPPKYELATKGRSRPKKYGLNISGSLIEIF